MVPHRPPLPQVGEVARSAGGGAVLHVRFEARPLPRLRRDLPHAAHRGGVLTAGWSPDGRRRSTREGPPEPWFPTFVGMTSGEDGGVHPGIEALHPPP